MSGASIAVRVDASPRIGVGHAMRCLSLADAARGRGARVRFVSRQMPGHLRAIIEQRGHEFAPLPEAVDGATDDLAHAPWLGGSQAADARDTLACLSDRSWDWIVTDHYGLDARAESALRAAAPRILAIDDLADRSHDCDLLLDHNLYEDQSVRYQGLLPEHSRLLLGPRFSLIREAFRQARDTAAERSGVVRRVLVLFGGADEHNATEAAVTALASILPSAVEVDVIAGASNGHIAGIQAACAAAGYRCHVQADDLPALMAAADLAIGAGGGVAWERCCVGLPAIAFVTADNQRRQVSDAALAGLLYAAAGDPTVEAIALHVRAVIDNPPLLRLLSRTGRAAVDGRGTTRVLRAMGVSQVTVRLAAIADAAMMLEWRNHPDVRRVSHDSGLLTAAAHQAWLAGCLADPARLLLVGERGGEPVGVVRFDLTGEAAEVSIYLAPSRLHGGLGPELLAAAEHWLADHHPGIRRLDASVLGDNRASHGLFRTMDYAVHSTRYGKGTDS